MYTYVMSVYYYVMKLCFINKALVLCALYMKFRTFQARATEILQKENDKRFQFLNKVLKQPQTMSKAYDII